MPLRFNSVIVPLSMMAVWVIFGGTSQAQFDGSSYPHGHSHHSLEQLDYPHFLSHDDLMWDHDVLIDESYGMHESREPIGSHRPFVQQPLRGVATMGETFGECPNAFRCPYDVGNLTDINDRPPTWIQPLRPYGLPSATTQIPDPHGHPRSSGPNLNSI